MAAETSAPVEFEGRSTTECRAMLAEALAVFASASLDPPIGMQPPAWLVTEELATAMAELGFDYVCSARDIVTHVHPDALTSMSGLPGVPLYEPSCVFEERLIHFPTNFQATSSLERAVATIRAGGLLSIKAHIVKNAVGHIALDGVDRVYMNYLDVLFCHLEREFGEAIWWTTGRGLDPAAVTLADVLRKAGYATGMFGKWHLGTRQHLHPESRGFDTFYGFLSGAHSFLPARTPEPVQSTIMRGHTPLTEPEYLTDAIARESVRFIETHKDEPFFCYVPFNAVHTPIEATKKYRDRFPNVSPPRRRDYYAMTSALDDAVGAITAALERHRLTQNTIVIFLNDNGGPLYTKVQSNGPLRFGKLFLFEGGVRVPMIIRWPDVVKPDREYDGVTSSLDIFPTVCAAAGIRLPGDLKLDGVDLTRFLTGDADGSPHDTLFWIV